MKLFKAIIFLALINLTLLVNLAAQTETSNFPFQNQALRLRLNQGFFDLGGEILEDIMKQSGFVSQDNVILLPQEGSTRTHYLRYKDMSVNFKLEKGKIISQIGINIADSTFYIKPKKKCHIKLSGLLEFKIIAGISASGEAEIELPKDSYNDKKLKIKKKKCGFFMDIGISLFVRKRLASAIKDGFYSIFNTTQIKIIEPLQVDNLFSSSRVIVNQEPQGFLTLDDLANINNDTLKVETGILGFLSNQNGHNLVIAKGQSEYVQQMGMSWSFNAGVRSLSQNIFDPNFSFNREVDEYPFPVWGKAPFEKLGAPLDFSAAFMIKESFLQTLFLSLYKAGFFNIQIQQNLLEANSVINIAPSALSKKMKILEPSGKVMAPENFKDARVEMQFLTPPMVEFINQGRVKLSIPKFQLNYFVQTKNPLNDIDVLKIEAAFVLTAQIKVSSGGKVSFVFNDTPLEDFKIITRRGLEGSFSDNDLKKLLDLFVSNLLNKIDMNIPLFNETSIEVKYLDVDVAGSNPQEKTLSIYLK